jgi:hypothetical protein
MKRQIIIVLAAIFCLALLAGVAYASNQAPQLRDDTPAAAVALTVNSLSSATPITATLVAAAAATNTFANDGATFLLIKNTTGTAVAITITTPSTVGGFAVADLHFSIPATSGLMYAGPFDPSIFNDSSGLVTVDFGGDVAATTTVGAFKLPRY